VFGAVVQRTTTVEGSARLIILCESAKRITRRARAAFFLKVNGHGFIDIGP
jgi:hypothetical protein